MRSASVSAWSVRTTRCAPGWSERPLTATVVVRVPRASAPAWTVHCDPAAYPPRGLAPAGRRRTASCATPGVVSSVGAYRHGAETAEPRGARHAPRLLAHPGRTSTREVAMSIALPPGRGRSRVTPPAPPLLPMPLAVELDDSEWAILTGECGSCCRPVAECCGGCQGRFCQVCRDRR